LRRLEQELGSTGASACLDAPSAPLADKKTMCPPMLGKMMKLRTFIQKAPPWHYPVQHLPSSYNPYVGYDLFTVVRNPYTRIISEFYYLKPYLKRKNPDALLGNDPGYMNEWLAKRIKKMKKCSFQKRCFFSSGGHFIPQYKYIYSGDRKIVKHVIRFEHLEQDFAALMESASLNVTLPTIKAKARSQETAGLTAQNLTKETVELVTRVYKKDFILGNYSTDVSLA
jgi:hypothetical protein